MKKIVSAVLSLLCLVGMFQMEVQATGTEVLSEGEPKVMVSSYELVDGNMMKGEKFSLKLNIENTNQYADAYNVLLSVTSKTDNVRIVTEESNQFFFEEIGAGETVTCTLNLEALEQTEADAMVLDCAFTYTNKYMLEYTNTSSITPILQKQCALGINSVSFSATPTVGARSLVSVRYENTGATIISNVKMTLEGDIADSPKVIELEGVTVGEQKYADCYVNFQSVGNQQIKVYFTFENEEGDTFEVAPVTYQVKVNANTESDAVVTKGSENEFWSINRIILLAMAVCVGVIILTLLYGAWKSYKAKYKENRKRKSQGMEEKK